MLDRLYLPRERVSLGDRTSQFSVPLVESNQRRVQALLELFTARGLLSELAIHVRDRGSERLDFAILARVLDAVPDPRDKHLFKPTNGLVPRGKSLTQLPLLAVELLDERAVVLLQLPQPANVRAAGGTDEVREHVHVTKRLLHDRVGRDRMAQQRPICSGDIAALHRRVP